MVWRTYKAGGLYRREYNIKIKHDKLISEQFNISKSVGETNFL